MQRVFAKLAQEELQKPKKCYKEHLEKKAKPRRLEMGDQAESNKLLMRWSGPYTVESRVGANNYKNEDGVQD